MKITLIALLLLLAFPTKAATYYISKSTGADTHTSVQAQSKSTAWQHLPGMASCSNACASYTPVAGDTFILMGCDSWLASDLPVEWDWSGTSGSHITITVDKTWFNSTACPSGWNRPIFNGQKNTGLDSFIEIGISGTKQWDVFDNIEMIQGGSNDLRYLNCFEECTNDTYQNMYLHAWNVVTDGNCDLMSMYGAGNLLKNNIVDGSDATGASPPGATCYAEFPSLVDTDGNVIHDVANGIVGHCTTATSVDIGGNLIYNVKESNAGSHPNAIEIVGGDCTYTIHDNVIHDNAGEALMFGNTNETDFIWNNVFYNILGNSPEAPQVPGQTGMTFTAWNNTIVDTPGENCFHWNSGDGGTFTAVTVKNTHCISSAATADASWNGRTPTLANNTLMSAATATSQGYTSGETFAYSPTLITNSTVGAGANLTASCTGSNAGLCSDTSYACTQQTISGVVQAVCPGRTANSRPGSGVWDSGAYEFTAGSTSPPAPAVQMMAAVE